MRVFSIGNLLKTGTEIILGSLLFTAGCLILVIESIGLSCSCNDGNFVILKSAQSEYRNAL